MMRFVFIILCINLLLGFTEGSKRPRCDNAYWWESLDRAKWSVCPKTNTYLRGFWRSAFQRGDERVGRLEEGRCCDAVLPLYAGQPATCSNTDWSDRLNRYNVWALCPSGYFMNGLRLDRSLPAFLNNIAEAKCCRPQNHPSSSDDCYDEDVTISFDKKGWSECQRDGFYMTGFYKSDCNNLYCIEKFRCCKMINVPVRLNGSNVEYGGRVEVFYKGKWAKICRKGWDFDDVKVICRQLGFEEALAEFISSDVMDDGIPFVMSDVSCKGDEPELASCARIDGKVNISPQCLSDGKGSQALCQPKSKKVLEKKELYFNIGSNEELRCSIHNETSYARWTINGQKLQTVNSTSQRIRTKENGELFIDKVQLSDAGLYECYRLEYVQYYIVYVNVRPRVDISGASNLIIEGNSVNLTCEIVAGRPEPEITWLKNDIKQEKSWFPLFPKINKSDEGRYRCEAQNDAGMSFSREVNFSVNAKFTDNTLDQQTLTAGTSGIISCGAQGEPSPQIYWRKKGGNSFDHRRFTQVSNGSLHISPVKPEDNGTFICTSKQTKGAKRVTSNDKDILVTIRRKASAQVVPKTNQTLTAGEVLTLTCKVNRETVNITWKKDGKSFKERAAIFTRLSERRSKLVITEVVEEESGEYSCEARNKLGSVAHSSVILDVKGKASAQVFPATHHSLRAGEVLTLTCKVNRETVNITWKKDGESLKERAVIDTRLNERKSKLVITEVVEEDSGEYSCEASNKLGTVAQSSVILGVKVSPQIIAPLTDQSVTEGYPVNFSCVASGVPIPTIVWDFNNGDLPSGVNQTDQEGESVLELPRVTKEMEGTYNCKAKNKENTASSSAALRVYEKASAQVIPETDLTLTTGEVLTLTCLVNEETVKITWKKDGESLKERAVVDTRSNKTKRKLVITEVVEEDSGEYSCEASNKLGTVAHSSVILDVKEAPSSSSLEWYYIGGPVAAVIFLLALTAYIKNRRATACKVAYLLGRLDVWGLRHSENDS
ncbi:Hemicentin-1 [Stylophora pistillata]|uniref:Hemicentin-1 n=1 Tax=Stylophora pistillata TaxID=50429 RepID=A0A2B4R7C9_STYPI|nr:Hemicentin-1 [Stylophora pistillata]